MWSEGEYGCTPAPAPAPAHSSVAPRLSFHPLSATRQYRSMDDPDGMYMNGGMGSGLDALSISTVPPPPPPHLQHSSHPLSNPISTTHAFWQNVPAPSHSSTLKGYSLEAEFAQLRQEYAATLEKLNQTMFSIKTFWSPELKRERQLRREEQQRIALLQRRVNDSDGGFSRGRLEGLSVEAEHQLIALQDSCTRLQEALTHKEEQIEALCMEGGGGRRAIENAVKKIDEKNQRIMQLEEEVMDMRNAVATKPRDFTEKGATAHELITLRMKLERSEIELSEKKADLSTSQTRLRNAEDELRELRSHVQLLKDNATSKEEQSTLLLGDVDALRGKLEMRNRTIEQKEEQLEKAQKEMGDVKAESAERLENMRKVEARCTQLVGRAEQLEGTVREKETELEKARQRLAAHPDTQREREWHARIEEMERERHRLINTLEEVRLAAEKEHKAQLETYQTEVDRVRHAVDTLEKELADRDVLLESQNEKIGDLGREVGAAEKRIHDAMVDKGTDELRRDLETARSEIEKLLRIVSGLEKEKATLTTKWKQLMGEREKGGDDLSTPAIPSNVKQRIQELEEALAESVSITAEREVHLSQQKQQLQLTSAQLADARKENKELRSRLSNVAGEGHDALLKSVEAERKQHMEQLYQLKQEALLSAISEKEAHVTLLERAGAPPTEIDTVRRHKEALMRKLQEENERRAYLHRNPLPLPSTLPTVLPSQPSVLPGNMAGYGASVVSNVHQQPPRSARGVDVVEVNDDGIWA